MGYLARWAPGRVITGLGEAEGVLARGQSVAQVCWALGVTEQMYCRWRKEMWRHADRPGQAAEAVGGRRRVAVWGIAGVTVANEVAVVSG